ncbi:helix-turn-helix domain-containing protein [Phytomonospora endophytica]|uniref:Transcriptional regulator with XRE-family HTH domain n=1 Tax=Phytomonospora endophytica TaxID=714109 RepID=A0A841FQE6_9ACTN|nr:transcriptional regulator [Phytomonospora endophytica]MBB6039511.1 transcriptional regulator with XRE-family HTH domain [Phytomonospora endophytica]
MLWLWTSVAAKAAIATGNLAAILRTYRTLSGVTQKALADALGYDVTYISALENERRHITSVSDLRRIADHLGLPRHILGITDPHDADYQAMLQFGESTLRLAIIARGAGKPAEAINELWPLIVLLEARLAEGQAEHAVLDLLARARAQLGVFLGDVLPKERLATATRWTGRALHITSRLDDQNLHAYALRVHGNELRKAGNETAALTRLQHAAAIASDDERPAALVQLARAAAEVGHAQLFVDTLINAHRLCDVLAPTPLFNPTVLTEVQLRGLMRTDRTIEAINLVSTEAASAHLVAPQWRIIERITTGEVLLAAGDASHAVHVLKAALSSAEVHRLPQQIQRIARLVEGTHEQLADAAAGALARLR